MKSLQQWAFCFGLNRCLLGLLTFLLCKMGKICLALLLTELESFVEACQLS